MQLSTADRARITEAIKAAEARTSGEIYCVITRAAADYRVVPLAWAAVLALIAPLPLIYLTAWPASVIYILQLAAFLGAFVGLQHPRMRYRIVPWGMRRDTAHGDAVRQFAAHGLQNTAQRTGVLIYVAVAERYAEVLADSGIAQKVDRAVWDEVVEGLTGAIKRGQAGDGLVGAIERCAAILAEHMPPGAINRDELPNAIIEI